MLFDSLCRQSVLCLFANVQCGVLSSHSTWRLLLSSWLIQQLGLFFRGWISCWTQRLQLVIDRTDTRDGWRSGVCCCCWWRWSSGWTSCCCLEAEAAAEERWEVQRCEDGHLLWYREKKQRHYRVSYFAWTELCGPGVACTSTAQWCVCTVQQSGHPKSQDIF